MEKNCILENLHILTETIVTVFLYGNQKLLAPLIGETIKSYLKIFIDNEGEGRELRYLIEKLINQTFYIKCVINTYVPAITPIIEGYPKSAEPGFSRVYSIIIIATTRFTQYACFQK